MRKIAIFVEGQTELIFVRESLLRLFDYQNIWIECFTLFTDSKMNTAEYAFPNDMAENYFQVIWIGNDVSVISRILRREQHLWNAGFERIIGLRDMYSKAYREAVGNGKINAEISKKFIDQHKAQIKKSANRPGDIYFHFAIMETEAWILGIKDIFSKINPVLTSKFIKTHLEFDLNTIDPESEFFHPANVVEKIFALINQSYNKSKGNIYRIVSQTSNEDYHYINNSTSCASFSDFFSSLPLPALE